ncbi:MAG TPA: MBL fold metallo-hydrolase, partial [Saprospiraceae bacterium]|nr:MBL fold metallo-hydrolase [Saprospiraceae bacterium]
PHTQEPLAIEYLQSINVDLNHVVLVVCTHWHNDHIRGLAKVLSNCPNAEFSFSAITDLQKFLYLCELDYTKTKKGSISSTNEFANCMQIINDRGTNYIRAQSDLVLLNLEEESIRFELFSLSPSPKTITNFDSEISQLITEFGTRNTAIINRSPNEKSVALYLKFQNHRVILGSDLEIGKSEHEGWRHIVKSSKVIDKNKSELYKIPHHGSKTGYYSDIFNILIKEGSTLKLSPFKGSGLPTDEMLEVYLGHSSDLYMTSSNIVSKKPKKRDKGIEKIIDRSVVSISELKFMHGIIRSRINYLDEKSIYKTEVFGAGIKFVSN